MTQYKYTQRADWMLYIMGLLLPGQLIVGLMFDQIFVWVLIGLATLALIGLTLVFSSMTIEVTQEKLRWYFRFGVWSKSLRRSKIAGAKRVELGFWHAPGIRRTQRGWLYTMSGRQAVAIEDSTGKARLLGTNKPNELVSALRPSISA